MRAQLRLSQICFTSTPEPYKGFASLMKETESLLQTAKLSVFLIAIIFSQMHQKLNVFLVLSVNNLNILQ